MTSAEKPAEPAEKQVAQAEKPAENPAEQAKKPAEPAVESRTVVLLRHARSTANAAGQLAGRSPGVGLDETGQRQADRLVQRLAEVPIARVVSSPIERCLLTLGPLAADRGLTVEQDIGLAEVDYGDWTGRKLSELGSEKLWRTVQGRPSAAVFPSGEGLAAVSSRAVTAVRDLVAGTTGEGALLICSHGDVIKALIADALGMHLDQFQRISVGPCSVSVVRYSGQYAFVELLGETGSLAGFVPPPAEHTADGESGGADPGPADSGPVDAVPGGDTGTADRSLS